jgi:osmotically inducible lipoprotein OsmB
MTTTFQTSTARRLTGAALVIAFAAALSACSGMSARDQNTAVGAGAGAVGGAVLTGGSTIGTLGGAAIGGYIGNQVGTKP